MNSGRIYTAEFNDVPVLRFIGDVRLLMSSALDHYFTALYERENLHAIIVDLNLATGIDSTTLGLLAKMAIRINRQFGLRPTLLCHNQNINKILHSMNFDSIANIVDSSSADEGDFEELVPEELTEEEARQKVIEAHQVLMGLSESNRLQFQELVTALKREG